MTPLEEKAYLNGEKMAWGKMARECIRNLDDSDEIVSVLKYKIERAEAINILRSLCENFGDTDWNDNLHLADIIEKHLGRHLYREEK